MRFLASWFGVAAEVLLAGVLAVAVAAGQDPGFMTWNHPPKEPQRLLEHATYPSRLLGAEVGYAIYLPAAYRAQPDRRFPVVYWCHGLGHSESSNQFPVEVIDAGIRVGTLPPLLVVYVCGGQASFYSDSADGRWPVERSLISELIPHIDARYRTLADRESRAIQGMDMGGFGAIKLALRHPDVFGSAVAFAAGLRGTDEMKAPVRREILERVFGGDAEKFRANDPGALVAGMEASRLTRVRLRLYCGLQDALVDGNRRFHRALEAKQAAVELIEVPGVGHDLAGLAGAVGTDAVEFAVRHFAMSRASEADGPWVNPPAVAVPGLEHHVFFSEIMRRPVGYTIFLPPGYAADPGARFPVVYHLPGMGGHESSQSAIARLLDHAMRAGQLAPMIWVAVCGGRASWFSDSADGTVRGESVVTRELIPHIDARWRTLAARGGRGVEGFRTGAAGALRLAARHPDLFRSVVLLAGHFPTVEEMRTGYPGHLARVWGSEAAWQADSVWSATAGAAGVLRAQVALRQVVGARDPFVESNRRLYRHLGELGIAVDYAELPGLEGPAGPGIARTVVAGWRFHHAHFSAVHE